MKKQILMLAFVMLTYLGFSQITSFSVESTKDYDNNTRISYLKIEGVQNIAQADNLQNEIVKRPKILRFTFYEKKDNLNRCMIQTDNEMNDTQIEELINSILVSYQTREKEINEIIKEMPVFVNTGNPDYDNQIYREKKESWIKSNPEKYKKLTEPDISNFSNPEKTEKEKITK